MSAMQAPRHVQLAISACQNSALKAEELRSAPVCAHSADSAPVTPMPLRSSPKPLRLWFATWSRGSPAERDRSDSCSQGQETSKRGKTALRSSSSGLSRADDRSCSSRERLSKGSYDGHALKGVKEPYGQRNLSPPVSVTSAPV